MHVRFLNRIKDLNARVKMAKRAADEGWSSRMTEKEVEKLLNKAHKKSPKKGGPDDQYTYNHFILKLIGREIEVSGRRFKMDEEMLDEFISSLRVAILCFKRDLEDRAKATQETLGSSEPADPPTPTDAAIPVADQPPTTSADATTTEAPADLQQEEANFKSGGQAMKDILAEVLPPKPPTDPSPNPEPPTAGKVSNS